MKKILMFAVSALLMGGLMMSCGPKQQPAQEEDEAIEIMDEPIEEEEIAEEEVIEPVVQKPATPAKKPATPAAKEESAPAPVVEEPVVEPVAPVNPRAASQAEGADKSVNPRARN